MGMDMMIFEIKGGMETGLQPKPAGCRRFCDEMFEEVLCDKF